MNIRQFKKDLRNFKYFDCYRIDLYCKGVNIGCIFPYHLDEISPIETEQVEHGVYLISSGALNVIADEYRTYN